MDKSGSIGLSCPSLFLFLFLFEWVKGEAQVMVIVLGPLKPREWCGITRVLTSLLLFKHTTLKLESIMGHKNYLSLGHLLWVIILYFKFYESL
jgi:hypothetical protein